MKDEELTVTTEIDRPKGGMCHTGPNPCWVTIKHHPTGVIAKAYHRQQHKARELAMACVEIMVEDASE